MGSKIKGHTEPEHAVHGSGYLEVGGTQFKCIRIIGEKAEPIIGPDSRGEAENTGDKKYGEAAGPGKAPGACKLTGAEIDADGGGQDTAGSKGDWNQDKFQPAAQSIAGECCRAVLSGEPGDD